MNELDRIRLFGLAAPAMERDLDGIEDRLNIDLQRNAPSGHDEDEDYYPQFDQALRAEAAAMSRHYELFYCLERNIRRLIAETLKAQHGAAWWATSVPEQVRQNAASNMQRETDSGNTMRSEEDIDYTTFGELGEIVRRNWPSFGGIFSSEKAFTKIMTSLNVLRGPIAHCCPITEDEILRLRLTLKDWFRLME